MLTANTQPAVLTNSVALLRALGETPDVAAGHSLGEYSAHVCAGSLRFEDAVRLVRLRGQFMQEAVPVGEGAMAAILKLEDDAVRRICDETEGVVRAGQLQLPRPGGHRRRGGGGGRGEREGEGREGRAMPLPVSAPFHCQLMRPAEEKLAAAPRGDRLRDPALPVYVNVDAAPLRERRRGARRPAAAGEPPRPLDRVGGAHGRRRRRPLRGDRRRRRAQGDDPADRQGRARRVSVQGPADFRGGARAAIAEARG